MISPRSSQVLVSYEMSEGSGTTAYDSSSNTNNLTLVSTPPWKKVRTGSYAVDFDGSADHGTATQFVSGSSARTHIIQFKADSWTSQPYLWAFGVESNSRNDALVVLNTGVYYWNTYITTTDGDTVLNTGQWYTLIVTHDGTTQKIYLDGVLDGTPTTNTLNTGASTFYLGRYNAVATQYFNGQIAHYSCLNYAVTAEQALQIHKELFIY